jgi:DNA processing protein
MNDPSLREVAIALHSHPSLSRPALYRLVAEAPRWLGAIRPSAELAVELGVPRAQMAKALARLPEAAAAARRECDATSRLGAHLVTTADDAYPQALRRLDPPPPVLAVRGELPTGPAVAVVGSRRADPYGREAAQLFARSLAAASVAVVSGFARGVDAAAHRGALEVAGGKTVAVLGCGLDIAYPRGHAGLGDAVAENGAVITEFSCGTPPRDWLFPVRNRSIAALSLGVLVVQAALRSGSLVTARHAADLGLDVWAIPGSIFDERALGTNALIREGAGLVQHPRDLLEELFPGRPQVSPARQPRAPEDTPVPVPRLPGLAGRLLDALPSRRSLPAEELAAICSSSVDQALGALLELELGGWIRRLPGPVYERHG